MKASDFQIELREWRQLCKEAALRATDKSRGFAAKMLNSANQWGLRSFVTEAQMDYLCKIADRVPPPLRAQGPTTKIAYVKPPERKHPCRWPRCAKRVAAEMWGCMEHWRQLPENLRKPLLKAHSEMNGDGLTPEYIAAYGAIQAWIKRNFPEDDDSAAAEDANREMFGDDANYGFDWGDK